MKEQNKAGRAAKAIGSYDNLVAAQADRKRLRSLLKQAVGFLNEGTPSLQSMRRLSHFMEKAEEELSDD